MNIFTFASFLGMLTIYQCDAYVMKLFILEFQLTQLQNTSKQIHHDTSSFTKPNPYELK